MLLVGNMTVCIEISKEYKRKAAEFILVAGYEVNIQK
jgi:hypothetical protein